MNSTAIAGLLPDVTLHDTALGAVRVLSFCSDRASSHLLIAGGKSVLIDCHDAALARAIERLSRDEGAGAIPTPSLILHTHIQPEHCREAGVFTGVPIAVPEALADMAARTPTYEREANVTWENPELWPVTMGREKYGVGGSPVLRPPTTPLTVSRTFNPGDTFPLGGATLRAVALPGHGWHACGFALEQGGKPVALFSADLLRDGPTLVNFFDLEKAYGQTYLKELPEVLTGVADAFPGVPFFPATGPVISDGAKAARGLADKITRYGDLCRFPEGSWPQPPQREFEMLGKYRKHAREIYQLTTFGNTLLFIDDEGHGLMVDPGPCDFEHPKQRLEDFRNDLKMFETHAGLKTIDLALVTHFHGDHYDCAPLLKERYPDSKLAAWTPVARVLENPDAFPYACKLPWYNLGLGAMKVDLHMAREKPLNWRGREIRVVHLPGHCNAHAAYLMEFNGQSIAITGDSIQTYGWPETLGFIISNDSTPDEQSGCVLAYKTMMKERVELNLGGHSSWFIHPAPVYAESVRRMELALPALRDLVPGGDLPRAFVRPGFPDLGLAGV